MRDSFVLNFLSAINVAVGFAFYLVIGRLWGLSKELDLFFSFYVLLNYTGYIVQIFWEGYAPFYAELKTKEGKMKADKLFSVLMNRSFLIAVLLIFLAILLYPVVNKIYFSENLKSFTLNEFCKFNSII
jgi:peptidoglycan biosynthesis protein MviN/MurJ (putative lipid II flippase)